MDKIITQRRRSLLSSVIAFLFILGAAQAVSSQKNLNAKFPKPDFSEMEEYWEIVSYEFDYTYANSHVPQLIVVAKKKQDKVLYRFDVDYYDADNVRVIPKGPLWFDAIAGGRNAKVGEPVRSEGIAPFMDKMKKVKKIVVTVSDAN